MEMQRLSFWDEVDEFLISKPTPDEIVAFHPSELMIERARVLLELQQEDALQPEEQVELDEITEIERFMIRLKAKALSRIDS